jgi:hypothetical protein
MITVVLDFAGESQDYCKNHSAAGYLKRKAVKQKAQVPVPFSFAPSQPF